MAYFGKKSLFKSSPISNNRVDESKYEYELMLSSSKSFEYNYKSEINQLVRDIEDTSCKSDKELLGKYVHQINSEGFKKRLREYKHGVEELSILHLAAKYLRKSLCLFLIDEVRIDKDTRCKNKSTPLMSLVKHNVMSEADYNSEESNRTAERRKFKEVFNIFLNRNVNLNAQDEYGNTAVHYAALKNNYMALSNLLQKPLNTIAYIEDKKGFTPLHVACKNGNREAAELLIDTLPVEKVLCFQNSCDVSTPLHLLCRNKSEHMEIFHKFFQKLQQASSTSNVNYVTQMLQREDSLSKQTLFHVAIESNHLKMVECLLRDYKVNKQKADGKLAMLPIHFAAKNGSVEMLELLIKYDSVSFEANANKENALHIAAANNKFKFIKRFLQFEHEMASNRPAEESSQLGLVTCVCACDSNRPHEPLIRKQDKNNYTPLLTALVNKNQKCIESLLVDKNVELNVRDNEANTILHICAQYDNSESLKHFLDLCDCDLIMSKNASDETVLHNACQNGNLEMIKLILNKVYNDSASNSSTFEQSVFNRNKQSQTAFHIACIKGYYNIVEYLLKERNLTQFLEMSDQHGNTSLHLATLNGHSSIVSLLLDYGADVNAKNEENLTALDLSCRHGFFLISKQILNNYPPLDQENGTNGYPLHIACYEGAYEVVRLLLLKGTRIDKLNKDNENCLDIAIKQGNREVIRVLLDDKNWHLLFRTNQMDYLENEHEDFHIRELKILYKSTKEKDKEFLENPQLYAIYTKKMWDIFKLVLDRCVEERDVMNFEKIDPIVRMISRHPLMLIAQSGQENLLKHETTRTLLDLKWRSVPRFAFYFNLIFYILFLFVFSMYSVELSHIGQKALDYLHEKSANRANNSEMILNSSSSIRRLDINQQYPYKFNKASPLFFMLFILLTLELGKELFQIMLIDGFSYFISLQNLIELFTYMMGLLSLLSNSFYMQAAYGSIGILFAFILFPFYMQKLDTFGLYVVAFRRTLANSAKFFPIFLIIFAGFILSFNIRSHFGVSYFNSTDIFLLRTFTMVVGEFESEKMGLYDHSVPNLLIYFMFIGLMSVILINLFVGIAVGEIKTVLEESDIQQISMRIVFVLKVQSALYPFRNSFLKSALNMNFGKYDRRNETKLQKFKNELRDFVHKLFTSNELKVKLSDPQKRLEESLNEIAWDTSNQIKSIKFNFTNQISDVESRLANMSRRLQDSIVEMNYKSNEFWAEMRNQMSMSSIDMTERTKESQLRLEHVMEMLSKQTNSEFKQTNRSFFTKLSDTDSRIVETNVRLKNFFYQIEVLKSELEKNISERLGIVENRLDTCFDSFEFRMKESSNRLFHELDSIKVNLNEKMNSLEDQLKFVKKCICKQSEDFYAL